MGLADIKEMDNIYNRQVQDELIKAITAGLVSEAITTAIQIHKKRNNIMVGLQNRIMLDSASSSEWVDPREADGVPIFARVSASSSKENHKLHTPFDRVISMQKASYMVGIQPDPVIEDETAAENIKGYLSGVKFETGISEVAQKAAGKGTGYMLLASPPGKNDVYITYPDEWGCFVLYDTQTGDPLYGVRYWIEIKTRDDKQPGNDESRGIAGEIYGATEVSKFSGGYSAVTVMEPELHLFEGVPLLEYPNNSERIGDVELTMSLQDAFDIADSDISSEISQLRLAYLSISDENADIDEDWLRVLKQTGIFLGDGKFIEKNINSQAVENLKKDLESRIYKYSNSYNPDELGADKALTAFQIQQKLLRLESSSKETELLFKESLSRMVLMIAKFKSIPVNGDDLSWKFTRNTPRNALEDLKLAVESGFKLSQKMMARIMPFEIDQDINEEELEDESGGIELDPFSEIKTDIPADPESAVESAKLSGIQISSANEIISQVSRGELSRDAGLNQLKVFLGLSEEQANKVMGKVQNKTTTEDE